MGTWLDSLPDHHLSQLAEAVLRFRPTVGPDTQLLPPIRRREFLRRLNRLELYCYCRGLVSELRDYSKDGYILASAPLPPTKLRLGSVHPVELGGLHRPRRKSDDLLALGGEQLERLYQEAVTRLKEMRLFRQSGNKSFTTFVESLPVADYADVLAGKPLVAERRSGMDLFPTTGPAPLFDVMEHERVLADLQGMKRVRRPKKSSNWC